ncbi:hypothetical protein LEP1GSC008_3602 [Leptospira kirschneri serovar Bulgarica str. Nikolaevo]|uniref:Uncharacterized protein n=1 Tax=Leptospira kirschneri serovar Bulgarica str. Nikolaevo TaxID=1240687 RepID=M6F5I7_9LEPT|nr:hypothetical protein LEP1GSC008_3602 [Leptospira kirschneri serovar Bulgarica str. Nikolaevo]
MIEIQAIFSLLVQFLKWKKRILNSLRFSKISLKNFYFSKKLKKYRNI